MSVSGGSLLRSVGESARACPEGRAASQGVRFYALALPGCDPCGLVRRWEPRLTRSPAPRRGESSSDRPKVGPGGDASATPRSALRVSRRGVHASPLGGATLRGSLRTPPASRVVRGGAPRGLAGPMPPRPRGCVAVGVPWRWVRTSRGSARLVLAQRRGRVALARAVPRRPRLAARAVPKDPAHGEGFALCRSSIQWGSTGLSLPPEGDGLFPARHTLHLSDSSRPRSPRRTPASPKRPMSP